MLNKIDKVSFWVGNKTKFSCTLIKVEKKAVGANSARKLTGVSGDQLALEAVNDFQICTNSGSKSWRLNWVETVRCTMLFLAFLARYLSHKYFLFTNCEKLRNHLIHRLLKLIQVWLKHKINIKTRKYKICV